MSQVFYMRFGNYFVVFFWGVCEGILVFEVVGLVELGELAVELEEELDDPEDVEVGEVLELDLLGHQEAVGELVAAVHVLEADVEEDQSREEHPQLVADHLPPRPEAVHDEHPQVPRHVRHPHREGNVVAGLVPPPRCQKVQDGVQSYHGCRHYRRYRVKEKVQF